MLYIRERSSGAGRLKNNMKRCPYCGEEIPDDNKNVYCPHCNNIADKDVLLRMKIEKTIQQPQKKQPVMRERQDVGRRIREEYVEESSGKTIYIVLGVICVAAAAAAVWYFGFR